MQLSGQRAQLETVLVDVRAGFRGIRNAPGFSLLVILTMALGIGANTAVFSVVDAVLLRLPPYPHAERLVQSWETTSGQRIPVSWVNFQHWRAENHTFEEMASYEPADLTLTGRGDAKLTHGAVISSSFFRLLGWQPLAGRLIDAADDKRGAAPAVVVSSEFWAKNLSSDPHTIGATLALDGTAYQVVGILPPGLRFFTQPIDIYLPAGQRSGISGDRSEHGSMAVLGLLKPGVNRAAANADLDAIMQHLAAVDPGPEDNHRSSISWLAGSGTGQFRPSLLALMGAVTLVLIIACANVAGLFLLRGTTKTREIAIRTALGATHNRVARQVVTENLVLIALGGIVGLLFAGSWLRFLLLTAPQAIPQLWESSLNVTVLWFTAAVTLITGLLAALAPVYDIGALDIVLTLKDGTPASGVGKRGQSLRTALMISELAMTLILAFSCGLLVRSLIAAQAVYPGFDVDRLLAMELQLPASRYTTDAAASNFYERLTQQLRRLPGVQSVGAIDCPPSTGGCAKGWYSIADMPPPARTEVPLTLLTRVDRDYFHTMRIPLLSGHSFNPATRDNSREVVINQKLARRWWPAMPQLAIGHHVKLGGPYMDGSTCEIVGVAGNVNQTALDVEAFSEIYVRGVQKGMVVMVRTAGDPAEMIPAVRRELSNLDRGVPTLSIVPFSVRMRGTLERRRFTTLLLGIFAALAAALTGVGIYGLINYWVRIRQKEIAIRMTLGARRFEILQWTGWQVMRIAVPGLILGSGGCWASSRLLKSMVFGIVEEYPFMLLAASIAIIVLAVLAAGVPVLRATRIDPARHLQST